jgi:hypothetical protein
MKKKAGFIFLFSVLLSPVFTMQDGQKMKETGSLIMPDRKCSDFKTGTFRYVDYDDEIKITRNKKYQIEEGKNFKSKSKIKWTDDCTCILTLVETSNEKEKEGIGKTKMVKIILIDGDVMTVSIRDDDSKNTFKLKIVYE